MKTILPCLMIIGITSIVSCVPYSKSVATGVARTLTAMPTSTLHPTEKPYPTNTQFLTYTQIPTFPLTPTLIPISTLDINEKYVKRNALQILTAFMEAGLEVANPSRQYKKDTYPGIMVAEEHISFYTPSLCSGYPCLGIISYYSDKETCESEFSLHKEFSESLTHYWVFSRDNILVILDQSIKEENAREYESVLYTLE